MSVKLGKSLNKGDIIYRIFKCLDGGWYFCIYEVVKYLYHYDNNAATLHIAPIVTYCNVNHNSVSTIVLNDITENWIEAWPHPWDYITTDEYMAKCMYYEKTGIIE